MSYIMHVCTHDTYDKINVSRLLWPLSPATDVWLLAARNVKVPSAHLT